MAKTIAKVFGVLIILFSIIGFFSNAFVGTSGYFMANVGLNIVNLILGIVLVAASSTEANASGWLKAMGIIYFVLGVLGFFLIVNGVANVLGFMSFNSADNWLYTILGVILFVASFTEESTAAVIGTSRTHAHQ